MAYGNYNNNQNQSKGDRSPSVYSRYNFANSTSVVDKTRLFTRFWNGSLVMTIAPKNPDSPDDRPTYDNRNGIAVFLNHTKALMLRDILKGFIEDPDKFDNCGVNAGSSLITISKGTDYNSNGPLIIIRKVGDDGSIVSSFAYEVKQDYLFSIRGFDEKNPGAFDRVYYPQMELNQLVILLDEYAKAETRAVAYTVVDAMNWDINGLSLKLNRIGEKLGLDMSYQSHSGGASGSSGSYFTRNGNSSPSTNGGMADDYGTPQYTSATLDDME